MTTVREARIEAVVQALLSMEEDPGYDLDATAEAVVAALFTPDPLIDNATVPE